MIKPVILWTDALVFLLVFAVLLFAFYARGKPHLRSPWRRIFSGRMAAASAVILLTYVSIGILDSLHFRLPLENREAAQEAHYAVEVLSVLDVLLGPVRTRVEKSYSAPFATHLFTRETIEHPDGSQSRDYPRLEYGGAHLGDPAADRAADIGQRAAVALLQALLATAAVLVLLGAVLALSLIHI